MQDEQIIELFNERAEGAIEALKSQYGSRAMAVAEKILGDAWDAEETVNDALHVLWQKIPPEQPEHLWAYFSSPSATYSSLVMLCGGFAELERREDAASLLLQRWVEERERNEHKTSMLEYCGYTGLLLSRDVYWNRLTAEEKTLIHSYGCTREDQNQGTFSPFPGRQTFSYEVVVDGSYTSGNSLTVDYSGKKEQEKDDHVTVFSMISASAVQKPYHGWNVVGWFAEPTELTLTVTDRDGNLVRQDRLLVTPLEDGYQIDIIEQFS